MCARDGSRRTGLAGLQAFRAGVERCLGGVDLGLRHGRLLWRGSGGDLGRGALLLSQRGLRLVNLDLRPG